MPRHRNEGAAVEKSWRFLEREREEPREREGRRRRRRRRR